MPPHRGTHPEASNGWRLQGDRIRALLSEAETGYRLLFEANPLPMYLYDVDSLRILDVNEAAQIVYGYPRDEFLTLTVQDLHPSEERAKVAEAAARLDPGMQSVDLRRHRTKDGRLLDVETLAHGFVLGGRKTGLVLSHDVSERTQAQRYRSVEYAVTRVLEEYETLREAAPRLAKAVAEAGEWDLAGFWRVDRERGLLRWETGWHRPAAELGEFEAESRPLTFPRGFGLLGRAWETRQVQWTHDLAEADRPPLSTLADRAGLRGGYAIPVVGRGDAEGVFLVASRQRFDPDEGVLDMLSDIGNRIGQFVDRERAVASRRQADEDFRTAFLQSPAPLLVSRGAEGTILDASDAFLALMGYARDEIVGRTTAELAMWLGPEDREARARILREGRRARAVELRARTKSGAVRTLLAYAEPILLAETSTLLTTFVDITERKKAEEDVARSERKFRTLFESAEDGIALLDQRGTARDVNPAAAAFLGLPKERIVGAGFLSFLPEEERAKARAYFDSVLHGTANEGPLEVFVRRPDGRARFFEVRGRIVLDAGPDPYVQLIARDVTERRETQLALMESQRLASMAQVAAYVAHEVNTPLTNIALVSANIARRLEDPELRQRLEALDEQRRLASQIIEDLLNLTRSQHVTLDDQDLRPIVETSILQAASFRRDGVDVAVDLGSAPVVVPADPLRLQQAVVNLVKNAFQATEKGFVLIRLEPRPDGAAIVVSDTGHGIPPGIRARLFEPFVTTKPHGEGTGLGLSFTKGVVTAHGGRIEVGSEPGKGTTVTLVLPRRALAAA